MYTIEQDRRNKLNSPTLVETDFTGTLERKLAITEFKEEEDHNITPFDEQVENDEVAKIK